MAMVNTTSLNTTKKTSKMAASNSQLFLICTILIATSLQIHARGNFFFSKSTPNEQPKQGQEAQDGEYDFTPLSAFRETTSPPPSLSETTSPRPSFDIEPTFSPSESQNGHGLYGQYEIQEFPQASPSTESRNPTTNTTYSSFKTDINNDDWNFESKDFKSGFSAYGMSDTRVMENGKYAYHLNDEDRRSGFGYRTRVGGNGYEHPYKEENPSGGENVYANYGNYGSYDNGNGFYEPNNYKMQGNQEEEDEFLP